MRRLSKLRNKRDGQNLSFDLHIVQGCDPYFNEPTKLVFHRGVLLCHSHHNSVLDNYHKVMITQTGMLMFLAQTNRSKAMLCDRA